MVNMRVFLKITLILLFVVSIVCAVMTQSEQLRFICSAIAFLMLGIYNTEEYVVERKKITIVFATMFYAFCVSAIVFAFVG